MNSISFLKKDATLPIFSVKSVNLEQVLEDLNKFLLENKGKFIPNQAVLADFSFVIDPEITFLTSIKKVFSQNKLNLVGLCGESAQKYQDLLKTNNMGVIVFKEDEEKNRIIDKKTMVLRANIRSGQQIYAENRDLTIVGMVSAGAEILADGNINVLGALRGRAFAGIHGYSEGYVFASEFKAQLISIAGNYQNLDESNWGENIIVSLNKDNSMFFNKL